MLTLLAQITNPAVPALQGMGGSGNSGEVGANILGRYLAILIVTSITLGGLAVLLYMTLGAIQWITAGGDAGKIDKAKSRITQSLVGLALLTSITAVVTFIGPVFGIDILRLDFVNQITGGASTRLPTGGAKMPMGTGTLGTTPLSPGKGTTGTVRTNSVSPNGTNGGINLGTSPQSPNGGN